jgi:hypothetical protein
MSLAEDIETIYVYTSRLIYLILPPLRPDCTKKTSGVHFSVYSSPPSLLIRCLQLINRGICDNILKVLQVIRSLVTKVWLSRPKIPIMMQLIATVLRHTKVLGGMQAAITQI